MTSVHAEAPLLRISVRATPYTGLQHQSDIMLDRIATAPRSKIGPVIGHLDDVTMLSVNRALVVFLGLA
jgi:mRNA interferase MazF